MAHATHGEFEHIVEARRVVSRYKTGEVKKTEHVDYRWVEVNETASGDLVFCSPSTKWAEEHQYTQTVRRLRK